MQVGIEGDLETMSEIGQHGGETMEKAPECPGSNIGVYSHHGYKWNVMDVFQEMERLREEIEKGQQELEEKRRKFEEERDAELDRIEFEKFRLQDMEHKER